jgi:hypothetical protein
MFNNATGKLKGILVLRRGDGGLLSSDEFKFFAVRGAVDAKPRKRWRNDKTDSAKNSDSESVPGNTESSAAFSSAARSRTPGMRGWFERGDDGTPVMNGKFLWTRVMNLKRTSETTSQMTRIQCSLFRESQIIVFHCDRCSHDKYPMHQPQIFSLDIESGRVLWNAEFFLFDNRPVDQYLRSRVVCDVKFKLVGASITVLYVAHLVGIWIQAFDAATGKRLFLWKQSWAEYHGSPEEERASNCLLS